MTLLGVRTPQRARVSCNSHVILITSNDDADFLPLVPSVFNEPCRRDLDHAAQIHTAHPHRSSPHIYYRRIFLRPHSSVLQLGFSVQTRSDQPTPVL